jgi:hypothetical protein
MPDPQRILKLLRDELDLQRRHCKLLEAQQNALLVCDRPRFCGMRAEQDLMLALLAAQQTVREAELEDGNGNVVGITALIEQLPARQRRAYELVVDSLLSVAGRVQELSIQNKKLIENEMAYIAFALDLFVEAGRKARTVYGGSFRPRLLLDRRV